MIIITSLIFHLSIYWLTLRHSIPTALALTMTDRMEILDAHNKLRNMKNLKPVGSDVQRMYYDADLENMARKWAIQCNVEHVIVDQKDTKFNKGEYIGQNIFASSVPRANLTKGISLWWNEKAAYTFNNNSCSKVCGHYTQVVWAETQFVGCWMTNCTKWKSFLVCNYFPGGNMRGKQPYTAGIECSNCPKLSSNCVNSLCDTKESCELIKECPVDPNYRKHCLCAASFYDGGSGVTISAGIQLPTAAALSLIAASLLAAVIIL